MASDLVVVETDFLASPFLMAQSIMGLKDLDFCSRLVEAYEFCAVCVFASSVGFYSSSSPHVVFCFVIFCFVQPEFVDIIKSAEAK